MATAFSEPAAPGPRPAAPLGAPAFAAGAGSIARPPAKGAGPGGGPRAKPKLGPTNPNATVAPGLTTTTTTTTTLLAQQAPLPQALRKDELSIVDASDEAAASTRQRIDIACQRCRRRKIRCSGIPAHIRETMPPATDDMQLHVVPLEHRCRGCQKANHACEYIVNRITGGSGELAPAVPRAKVAASAAASGSSLRQSASSGDDAVSHSVPGSPSREPRHRSRSTSQSERHAADGEPIGYHPYRAVGNRAEKAQLRRSSLSAGRDTSSIAMALNAARIKDAGAHGAVYAPALASSWSADSAIAMGRVGGDPFEPSSLPASFGPAWAPAASSYFLLHDHDVVLPSVPSVPSLTESSFSDSFSGFDSPPTAHTAGIRHDNHDEMLAHPYFDDPILHDWSPEPVAQALQEPVGAERDGSSGLVDYDDDDDDEEEEEEEEESSGHEGGRAVPPGRARALRDELQMCPAETPSRELQKFFRGDDGLDTLQSTLLTSFEML